MKILITGGAGYIGSTIASALIDNNHTPIILDSLVNGKEAFTTNRIFYKGDIADESILEQIFTDHKDIACTIHCAALIVVPDSVANPYEYYMENVYKSLKMFKKINDLGCKRIVFSSSASVYGATDTYVVNEETPLNPQSPYARTKQMMEQILIDFCAAYDMKAILLRYFNPIGADPKFRSGSYIKNPSHLLGKLITASASNEEFNLTGVNWDTRDGTGIRDYIHVWDLALAHVKAVERFDEVVTDDYEVINLGNGEGVTVREFVDAFEKVSGKKLAVCETPPRPGDVAGAYAGTEKARRLLGWSTQYSVEEAIRDSLAWDERFYKATNAQ